MTQIFQCYRKLYVHHHSIKLPFITLLATLITIQLVSNPSYRQWFLNVYYNLSVQTYQNALGHSNFNHKLEYMPHVTQQPRRDTQGNIIWFKNT